MEVSFSKTAKILTAGLFLLVLIGLVILSSAGIVDGQKKFNASYYYVSHQITQGLSIGLLCFALCSQIPYKHWKKLALPGLLIVMGLLVLIFVPHIGSDIKGARRWINIGFFSFQPSEFLKAALIVYLAAWLSGREAIAHKLSLALMPLAFILGFVALLLVLQPDLGTLVILIGIALAMYFFANAPLAHVGGVIAFFFIALIALSVVAPYRLDRIRTFFDRNSDKQGVSYHINQALIGIGSGGVFGLGFGQSMQKTQYLPEPVGDSIFAIVVEELGLVGGVVILLAISGFVLILVYIAQHTNDQFARLFVLGLATWVFAQSLINIAAITGLMPLTGVPLPFISYGSSSLVALMASTGIAVNIAKNI